ncbi:uncharacterized protein [Rutidosis leptorrhynchoides]|uniref:uncharacterized protein n=1 Tax=Rutidosis leptorrhynchoides TaxID=125765 RepID=UPI003A98EB50
MTISEVERISLSPLHVGGVKTKVGGMTMILFVMEMAKITAVLDIRGEMIDFKERVAKSFPDPQPLGENSRRDRSKFCVFHDDYGHDTNRCRDLAELIAEAYEQGKLDHLIAQSTASTANAIILSAETNAPQVPNVDERKAPAVKKLEVKMVSKKENQRGIQVINVVEVQGEMSVFQISAQIASWQCPSIAFPPASLTADVDKPVVVSCRIADAGFVIMKVHVDTGSSVDVMYEQCFSKLLANIQALMKPTAVSLAGFSGESTWPVVAIIIFGRTALCMFGAILSTIHGMVKFSANKGIGTLTSAVLEPFCALIMARESVGVERHSVHLE